jgi:hypothetical protein
VSDHQAQCVKQHEETIEATRPREGGCRSGGSQTIDAPKVKKPALRPVPSPEDTGGD